MGEQRASTVGYSELAQLYRVHPDVLRRLFRGFNRLMVGVFRLGLGRWISSPYTGYVMVLTTTGRKSGLPRRTPVNYVMAAGDVYCMTGFGLGSDWYKNLLADPEVQVWVGNEGWSGRAEIISEPVQMLPIFRKIVGDAGFADSAFTRTRLTHLDDETLQRLAPQVAVVRIPLQRRLPKGEGPGDLAWLWPVLGAAFLAGRITAPGRKRTRGAEKD